MFFSERAEQAECLDSPERSDAEICDAYHWLGRVNHLTRFSWPFERWLVRQLGRDQCRTLSILDVGAGDGLLGRCLESWAKQQGWDWQVTNCDLSPRALALNPSGRNVVGSATQLPFNDNAFDVVIASQMTHHLDPNEAVRKHFAEAYRVSRKAILLCDLHRNVFFYLALGLTLTVMRLPSWVRSDGLISVRRGWRVGEWEALAAEAGLKNYKAWMEHGTRVLLFAAKAEAPRMASA
jgi:hypothetical protein